MLSLRGNAMTRVAYLYIRHICMQSNMICPEFFYCCLQQMYVFCKHQTVKDTNLCQNYAINMQLEDALTSYSDIKFCGLFLGLYPIFHRILLRIHLVYRKLNLEIAYCNLFMKM